MESAWRDFLHPDLAYSSRKMTSAQSNIIFDDLFTVTAIDMDGKKFDRGGKDMLRVYKLNSYSVISVTIGGYFFQLGNASNAGLQHRTLLIKCRRKVYSRPGFVSLSGRCFR